jgi:hypothetical protein
MRRRDLIARIALASIAAAICGAPALAQEKKAKKKSGGENYIPINPITGTTNKSGGRRGVLSVDCGLQVDDAKLREYAQLSLPRLRAAYEQVVMVYAAGLPSGAEPNSDSLAQSQQRQTDQILKRPGAKFLIGAVLVS